MIRNRNRDLILRKKLFGHSVKSQSYAVMAYWQEDLYNNKDKLKSLHNKNAQLFQIYQQYEWNPSVYILNQLNNTIAVNCEIVDQINDWLNQFRNAEVYQPLKHHIRAHFEHQLTLQITSIFKTKAKISQINPKNTINTFNSSYQHQYNNYNKNHQNQRINSFKEVNNQIQNLNVIMRRMGSIVQEQGDLVNRIDENFITTTQNMHMGKQQLHSRISMEEGQGEFSCYGTINKVIISLYALNVCLCIVLIIKSLLK